MRIDVSRPGMGLDQVRFEEDVFALDLVARHSELAQAGKDDRGNVRLVTVDPTYEGCGRWFALLAPAKQKSTGHHQGTASQSTPEKIAPRQARVLLHFFRIHPAQPKPPATSSPAAQPVST